MKPGVFNIEDYDTYNIRCYKASGLELCGRNARFLTNSGRSLFVMNNVYEIFEIPAKANNSQFKCEGTFLFIAHNVSFDYWIAAEMTYKINRPKIFEKKAFFDSVVFDPIGSYHVTSNGIRPVIKKDIKGRFIHYGLNQYSSLFDSVGGRKAAYNLSSGKILSKILHIENNPRQLSGGKAVPIYKKKQSNKRNRKN